MALGYAEIGEQKRDGLGCHGTAIVGMNDQLRWIDAFLANGFGQQHTRDLRAFTIGDRPANDVAAIDVDDHIEIEIRPLLRAVQVSGTLGGQLKSHTWGHFKTAHYPVGTSKPHT